MRNLYPVTDPIATHALAVSDLHTLSVEESGDPAGPPILFLHGGPGGGCDPLHRGFFHPAWRAILFDQRGCGKSTPHAELRENTTWDLVRDIETIREYCGIERWTVFGGSWGSTLALAYAVTYPERVAGLILRGIFLCRPVELRWFYKEGASWLFPDLWEGFLAPVAPAERGDLMTAYYRLLTGDDEAVKLQAARAWSLWEGGTSRLLPDPAGQVKWGTPEAALALARIECHYFVHNCWFESDQWLLEQAGKLAGIPGVIVQGRYDTVCPARSAWELHHAWPGSDLRIIPDAGHSAFEPGITAALVESTDQFFPGGLPA